MFVAKLDRPWLGTPMAFQGFWVRNLDQIDNLNKFCQHVWVRTDMQGRPTDVAEDEEINWQDRTARNDREIGIVDYMPSRPVAYRDTALLEDEFEAAGNARRKVCDALDDLVDDINRQRTIAIDGLQDAVSELSGSIMRNPDACMWLRLVKRRDTYTYFHLIDTSALAIAFGRHLGFSAPEIADIGLGAMLIDIGKLKLPEELLGKTGALTDAERELVQKHVDYSVELLKEVPNMRRRVLDIVAAHHERFDGGGYPNRLVGRKIPPFARMVAIADYFDAITSDKAYSSGVSPHDAMRRLYDAADKAFQRELVEQFIQCLGIYPTGTLVELNTGEVGIVVNQNRVRRLRPRLMLILGPDKQQLSEFVELDLMDDDLRSGDNPVSIARSVEAEQFGIDTDQFYIARDRVTPDFLHDIARLT
ncbi:MAG: HD-GYP domain-containing protein [Gammaproteobacteria bacterium]|nr:HD-GYP domain-containing protein [Gammaproteobacteria bacterium]